MASWRCELCLRHSVYDAYAICTNAVWMSEVGVTIPHQPQPLVQTPQSEPQSRKVAVLHQEAAGQPSPGRCPYNSQVQRALQSVAAAGQSQLRLAQYSNVDSVTEVWCLNTAIGGAVPVKVTGTECIIVRSGGGPVTAIWTALPT